MQEGSFEWYQSVFKSILDGQMDLYENQPPTRDKKKSSSVDFPQPGGTLNANMSNLSSIKSCND